MSIGIEQKEDVEPGRADYTFKAQIEQMDNGASMIIRRMETGKSFGTIVLKRVYVDFASLCRDLESHMEFTFNPGAVADDEEK